MVKVKLYRAAGRHVLKPVAVVLVTVTAVICHFDGRLV